MIDFKRNCTYFFLFSKPLLCHVSSLSLFLPAIKEWPDLRNHKAVSFSCFYTVSDFQSSRSVIWLLKNCLRFQNTYKFAAFLFVFNSFFLCFGHLLTIWFNVLVFIPHNQKIKSEFKKMNEIINFYQVIPKIMSEFKVAKNVKKIYLIRIELLT